MNKSKMLFQLLEKILNSDKNYNKIHAQPDFKDPEKIRYKYDSSYALKTHRILSDEASENLNPKDTRTKKAQAAIKYSQSGYHNMNSILRTGSPKFKEDPEYYLSEEDAKNHIKNLKTLTKKPTQHEFYAYRGINVKKAGLDIEKPGTVFQDRGFTSVSLRPQTAMFFGSSGKFDAEDHRNFRIRIRPGTRGHYLSSHNQMSGKEDTGEAEFLLHPGTKFKVGRTHTNLAGQKFTDLHIHSQEE